MSKKKKTQPTEKIIKNKKLKTTSHVEEGLRKSFGCIINEILEAEMDELLGNEKYKHIVEKKENYRNGYSKKILRSSFGNVEIEIPRDRNTEFNPVIVPKHTRNIFELEEQIIKLYTEKNTRRSIIKFVESVYGSNVAKNLINNIIDRILPEIERWKFSC